MSPPDPFSAVHGAGEELRTGPDYLWDNARREGAPALVVQRTLSGRGFFEKSGQRQLVGPGQALLFTHREPSRYGFPPESTEPYRLRFLTFAPADLRPLFERLRADFGSIVSMPDDCEATALFDEILHRFEHRSFRDRFHEAELLHRLLIALYREQVHGTRTSDPIEFGYHYLRDHFRSPINLKSVAAQCGISREHFIRTFRTRYRESPGALLRRLRLEHARTMLAATTLDVQSVARASGFTSSNTFCRAYRRHFARTPAAER
jgi:AraC-like DNA-binding protein